MVKREGVFEQPPAIAQRTPSFRVPQGHPEAGPLSFLTYAQWVLLLLYLILYKNLFFYKESHRSFQKSIGRSFIFQFTKSGWGFFFFFSLFSQNCFQGQIRFENLWMFISYLSKGNKLFKERQIAVHFPLCFRIEFQSLIEGMFSEHLLFSRLWQCSGG